MCFGDIKEKIGKVNQVHPRSTPCCSQQTNGLVPNNLECSCKVLWQFLSHAWICTYDIYNMMYIIIHLSLSSFILKLSTPLFVNKEVKRSCNSWSTVCRFQWILKPPPCQSFQKTVCSIQTHKINKCSLWSVYRFHVVVLTSKQAVVTRLSWIDVSNAASISSISSSESARIQQSKCWQIRWCDKIPPFHHCWFANWWFSPTWHKQPIIHGLKGLTPTRNKKTTLIKAY